MTLVAAWVRAGDDARVDELAARVVDPARAVAVLVALAAAVPDRASTFLDRARDLLMQVRHPDERAVAATALVRADVAAGRVDHALTVANSDYLRSVAAAAVARTDVDRALAIAGDIQAPRVRDRVLVAVAAADPAWVETVVDRLTDPVRRVEVLLTAGRLDDAMTVAARIQTSGERGAALASVAAALAERGDLDRAAAILPTIPGAGPRRATTLALIRAGATHLLTGQTREARRSAESVARTGRIDDALAIADGIRYELPRARARAAVAMAAAELGQIDRAFAILPGERESSATMGFAEAVARAGDLGRAVAMITDPAFLEKARGKPVWQETEVIAGAQAAAVDGRLDRALAVARSFGQDYYTNRALSAAAVTAARVGHTAVADRLAEVITVPRDRSRTDEAIAVATAERGDVDEALAVAERLTDEHARLRTLVAISRVTGRDMLAGHDDAPPEPRAVTAAYAGNGAMTGKSERVAIAAATRGHVDDEHRSVAYAVAVAAGGNIDRAVTIADGLRPWYRRRDALIGIARTLVAAGDIDEALAIVAPMRRRRRDHALWWIARTLGEHGRFADATAVALGISHDHDRDGALWTLLRAATIAGDPLALPLAQDIGDDRALASVARATADRGRVWDALGIVATITEPYRRASTWAHAATLLTPTERHHAATALLTGAPPSPPTPTRDLEVTSCGPGGGRRG